MVEVISTVIFDLWLRKLKDRQARLRIVDRIALNGWHRGTRAMSSLWGTGFPSCD